MAMTACPECHTPVSSEAIRCQACGAPGPRKRKVTTVILGLVVLGVLIVGGIVATLQAFNAGGALSGQ